MRGFVQNIEDMAKSNGDFRRVLYTAKHSQLVLMALNPGEEIGEEVHKLDQFFRIEEGTGVAVLDGVRTAIKSGVALVGCVSGVPAPPPSLRRSGPKVRSGPHVL